MKFRKFSFIVSIVAGIIALILWTLSIWYPNEINIMFPLGFNVIQLICLFLIR
jgi:hypothetical protein